MLLLQIVVLKNSVIGIVWLNNSLRTYIKGYQQVGGNC